MKQKLFVIGIMFCVCNLLFSQTDVPSVFKDSKWYTLGEERDVFTKGILNIDNTAWGFPVFGRLIFLQGYYAYGTPWSGIGSYGKYSVIDNRILFSPELKIPRWDESYSVKELLYTTSNRIDKSGYQLLIDEDETVSFYGWKYPTDPSFVIINKIPCKSVNIPIRILMNNFLYSLPNAKAKNLFNEKNYYGKKATIGKASIVFQPLDSNFEWVYISIDLTYDEPTDGGGPYYDGWIKKEYISEIINHNMVVVSDNLRLRSEPNLDESTKIITTLKKWSIVKILEVGDYINTINEIEDRWYYVSLENGITGWIFGGYAKQYDTEIELQHIKELYIKF